MVDAEQSYPRVLEEEKVVGLTGDEIGNEISKLVGQLGRLGTSESVEIKALESNVAEEELAELIAAHPRGVFLSEKVQEIMATTSKNGWFREGLDAENEPTKKYPILNETTMTMLESLKAKGLLTDEMAAEGRVNMAANVYLKISNERDKSKRPDLEVRGLISGKHEDKAVEIIKLKSRLFIEEQREAKLKAEQEDKT